MKQETTANLRILSRCNQIMKFLSSFCENFAAQLNFVTFPTRYGSEASNRKKGFTHTFLHLYAQTKTAATNRTHTPIRITNVHTEMINLFFRSNNSSSYAALM